MKINARDYRTNEVFKFVREGQDLTQEELAKLTGIGKSSIEKYEYGTRNFTFETLMKVAKACDLDVIISDRKSKK